MQLLVFVLLVTIAQGNEELHDGEMRREIHERFSEDTQRTRRIFLVCSAAKNTPKMMLEIYNQALIIYDELGRRRCAKMTFYHSQHNTTAAALSRF